VPTTLLLVENATVPEDPRVWAECTTLRDQGWNVIVPICAAQATTASSVGEISSAWRPDGNWMRAVST